ncbi:aldose 1-epimerase family protein [Pseudarthrobacter sp. C4D7]|uniref:aldose 1-epimerase family protein n=1 Tax=Pseudarthrobacter sp. C4D7 TaxID=2735268 RepID=UPI0015846303|nr:aldose 1-epimerase family protein [Pseudarthrobacter sp. C4D7]NUT71073.1 aldose 1-epimerase family protein [Pseudarthrobacter sp. C4D7]
MPGTEVHLAHGPYSAVVTLRGGALRELRHGGRDLVVGFGPEGAVPDYRGVICAPWPNRLADGTYAYAGRSYAAAVNEPERGAALHGLAIHASWDALETAPDRAVLGCRIPAGPAYPGDLDLAVTYSLSDDGLHATVRAVNTGTAAAPYGVCPHPYLVAGPAPLDDWSLELPAAAYLDVTPDRLLPVGMRQVDGNPFDFRSPRRLGPVKIDHAFTEIAREASGMARVRVMDPSGTGVELEWGTEWPWVQVHTADKPVGPDRLGLAVEPMTCPPDAFHSGTDLVHLQPGQSQAASWTIRALG